MKPILFSILFFFFLACKTVQAPATVGTNNLSSYIVRSDVKLSEENNYWYFTNETDFRNIFTLTKSLPGNIVIPDFNVQCVISIALKPTTRLIDIKFLKSTTQNDDLNVYYEKIVTTGTTFLHTPFCVATLPKIESVKRIHFYNGSEKEKTINL